MKAGKRLQGEPQAGGQGALSRFMVGRAAANYLFKVLVSVYYRTFCHYCKNFQNRKYRNKVQTVDYCHLV